MPKSTNLDIADASFVVVDTETTGTAAEKDRIIEIGAVRMQNGAVVDRFSQLINPERSIPHRITRMTGITTAMVFDQPTVHEVGPSFLDFLGEDVLVAHNVPFDLRFLNAELQRLGLDPIGNATLCTLRLARRLLPELRSRGLSSLIDFYQIQIDARHRALGDAEATAHVLQRLLRHLAFEQAIDTLDGLLSFQYKNYRAIRSEPAHLQTIRREVLPQVPEQPGVYFMKDGKGNTIYIGKAKSLQARVRSYFSGIRSQPTRTRKMVRAVRDVSWKETSSELEAMLLESQLIKEHKPRFNRAQRRYRNRPFLRLDVTHEAPSLSWTAYLQDDGAEYYGPLSGRRQAERIVEILNACFQLRECGEDTYRLGRRCLYASMDRCLAPCDQDDVDRYADEVQRVRDVLTGSNRAVLDRLEAKMKDAAERMEYEEAGQYRDGLHELERLMDKQQCLAGPIMQHNAIVVQRNGDSGVHLYVIRFGRLAETLTLSPPPADREAEQLRRTLKHHFDPGQAQPERYFKQEVDEIRILSHWMYTHREEIRKIDWPPSLDTDDVWVRVRGILDEM